MCPQRDWSDGSQSTRYYSSMITTKQVCVVQARWHKLTAKTKASDKEWRLSTSAPLQRRLDVAVNWVEGKGFPRLPSNCTVSEHLLSFRLCRLPVKVSENLQLRSTWSRHLALANLPSSVPVPCWCPPVHWLTSRTVSLFSFHRHSPWLIRGAYVRFSLFTGSGLLVW
jgi:hypothetical protein